MEAKRRKARERKNGSGERSCDGIATRVLTAIIIVTSLDVQIVWYMYTEFRRLLVALPFTQDVMCAAGLQVSELI